jgi:hypothetical protein
VAHGALAQLPARGTPPGVYVLSCLTVTAAQERLGLWQDPALQAACLGGACRVAATVAGAVASRGVQGAASSSTPQHRGFAGVVVGGATTWGLDCAHLIGAAASGDWSWQ